MLLCVILQWLTPDNDWIGLPRANHTSTPPHTNAAATLTVIVASYCNSDMTPLPNPENLSVWSFIKGVYDYRGKKFAAIVF